ncbi:hypothetical protein [Vibrio sp. WXL103]|uniref:hypothetical protein n=1 Tax=Vibrio sp. WXL103 TaxID=3450710 RepID=UPI003EC510FC
MTIRYPRPWVMVALLCLATMFTTYSPQSQAASDDECGIWMCLPTGFIGGCSGPKKAFKKRVRRGKSPLPSFSSCLVSAPQDQFAIKTGPDGAPLGADNFTSRTGIAAHIASHRVCERWHTVGDTQHCQTWKTVPSHYVKGTRCHTGDGYRSPKHCTRTYRYTEVYRNGQLFGETHFF